MRLRVVLSALLLPQFAACVLPASDAILIDEAQFRHRAEQVCFVGVGTEFDFGVHAERLEALPALLTERMGELGYRVVKAELVEQAWKTEAAAVGNLYDPNTGVRNDDRILTARTRVLEQLGCGGFLEARVAVVTAPFYQGIAHWDGAAQVVEGGGGNAKGYLPGLSLWIEIVDASYHDLFFSAGGLELVTRFERSGLFGRKAKSAYVPPEHLLADPKGIDEAVELAVAALPYLDGPDDEDPRVIRARARARSRAFGPIKRGKGD